MATSPETARLAIRVNALAIQQRVDDRRWEELRSEWMVKLPYMKAVQKTDAASHISRMQQDLEHNNYQVRQATQEMSKESPNPATLNEIFSDVSKISNKFNRECDRLRSILKAVKADGNSST